MQDNLQILIFQLVYKNDEKDKLNLIRGKIRLTAFVYETPLLDIKFWQLCDF